MIDPLKDVIHEPPPMRHAKDYLNAARVSLICFGLAGVMLAFAIQSSPEHPGSGGGGQLITAVSSPADSSDRTAGSPAGKDSSSEHSKGSVGKQLPSPPATLP